MTRSLVLRLPFTLGSSRVATRRQRTPGSAESPLQGLSPVRPPQGIEQGQSEVEISKRWISTHGKPKRRKHCENIYVLFVAGSHVLLILIEKKPVSMGLSNLAVVTELET